MFSKMSQDINFLESKNFFFSYFTNEKKMSKVWPCWMSLWAQTGDKKSWPLEKNGEKNAIMYEILSHTFFKLTDVHFVVIYLRSLNLCIKSRSESLGAISPWKGIVYRRVVSRLEISWVLSLLLKNLKPLVMFTFASSQYRLTLLMVLSTSFLTFAWTYKIWKETWKNIRM